MICISYLSLIFKERAGRQKMGKKTTGRRKKTGWPSLVIMAVAAAIFVFSAVKLGLIFYEYKQGTDEYNALERAVVHPPGDGGEGQEGEFQVDFEKLRAVNEDVVGWIRFENLAISYPIMRGEDNDYYLRHTTNRTENKAGSIFMDYLNAPDFSDKNTFVYGHNMKNKSMFGLLNNYSGEQYYREHPYFWIYTPQGAARYQIFSCYVGSAAGDSYQVGFGENEEFEAYLGRLRELSAYDTGVSVSKEDEIVSLSTCTASGDDYRFLVHGVKMEETQ